MCGQAYQAFSGMMGGFDTGGAGSAMVTGGLGGAGGGGGGASGGCSGVGSGPLAAAFGPNLTSAIADQLVQRGIVPPEYAAILTNPNSTAAQVAAVNTFLVSQGLPTNALDLARMASPITLPNGGGPIDILLANPNLLPLGSAGPLAMDALRFAQTTGTLTQAVQDQLRAAGLPTDVQGLARIAGIQNYGANLPGMSQLATVANFTQQEIDEIGDVLGAMAELEGMEDISLEDATAAMNDVNRIGAAFGVNNMAPEEAMQIAQGLGRINVNGQPATPATIQSISTAITSIPGFQNIPGAGSLNANDLASIIRGVSSVQQAGGVNSSVILSNMPAIASAFGTQNSSTITAGLNAIMSLGGGNAGGNLTFSGISSFVAQNGGPAALASRLPPGTDANQLLGNLTSLGNTLGNANLSTITGVFSAAQGVMSSGVLQNMNITQMSGLMSGMTSLSIPGLPNMGLGEISSALNSFGNVARFANMPMSQLNSALGSLGNIASLQRLGLDKFNKVLSARGAIQKLNSLGAGKIQAAMGRLQNLGPAQLQNLMGRLPNIPVDRLNRLMSGGMARINSALSNVPGVGTALNAVGGLSGLTGMMSGLSFSSFGCLMQSLLCPVTPSCGSASQANAASQSGQDDRYKDFCFKGKVTPKPRLNTEAEVASVNNDDLDMGADGSKPRNGCITHKNTPAKTFLSLNSWALKENGLDSPRIVGDKVKGYSELYKFKENEHKYRRAYVDGLGGTNTTIFGDENSGAPPNLRCNYIQPNCKMGEPGGGDKAVLNRLQLDACTNKYIFNNLMGLGGGGNGPEGLSFIFDPLGIRGDATYDQTFCQPLKMVAPKCEEDLIRGGCVKKKCDRARRGGCSRQEADKFDYEAWRYIANGWYKYLYLHYYPALNRNMPDKDNEAAVQQDVRDQERVGKFGGLDDGNWRKLGDGMAKDAWGTLDIQIDMLSKYPFERIWDPTHPFSPRYDYGETDRSYSDATPAYNEFGTCTVRCAAVPVDVMTFRAPQFRKCMGCRLAANTSCWHSDVMGKAWMMAFLQTAPLFPTPAQVLAMIPPAWSAVASKSLLPIPGCATLLMNDTAGNLFPGCSTKFDEPKDKVRDARGMGAPFREMCSPCVLMSGTRDLDNGVEKCCSDLAKPLTPINTLKIRNKKLDNLGEIPEGYYFRDYPWVNKKPYMRWWDTGGEAGTPGGHNQKCDLGADDAIVGVGAEKNRCRYGGGNGESYACITTIKKPDPLSSWMELKLYQANTYSEKRLNCIGQYEKIFKRGGAEDFVLTSLGKPYNATDRLGRSEDRSWPLSWRGYITDPAENKRFPAAFKASGFNDAISAPYGNIPKGLDNVQKGDVIIYDEKTAPGRLPHVAIVVERNLKADMAPDKYDPHMEFIAVLESNAGKYPDACGNTDGIGTGPIRYIHKHCIKVNLDETSSSNPYEPFIKRGVAVNSPNGGGLCYTGKADDKVEGTWECEDVNLQRCVEPLWNDIAIYRPCQPGTNNDCRDK
jgi:hypothetical protein